MAGNWSRLECELIVDDYLDMLDKECRSESINKSQHRQALKENLPGRTDGSIEYKHQNISAVLIRAGHVYVRGYKPAWNYQELLEEVVLDRISSIGRDIADLETSLIEQVTKLPKIHDAKTILVEPPERIPEKKVRETPSRAPRKINYSERESRNRALGERGEGFIVEFERRRLIEAGREDLVDDIEWTSKEKGDGTGYDIRSFEGKTDKIRYIEVKTTNAGKYQPFMISANELAFSDERATQFALYRLFDFSISPRMFVLGGRVADHVDLAPTMFRATY